MRKRNECGFLTKWLVYTLVVSVTMLYVPTGLMAQAYAAEAGAGGKQVYLFGFSKDSDATPVELVSKVESAYKDSLKEEEGLAYISPGKAKQRLSGDSEEAFKTLKGKIRDQEFDKGFFAQLKTVGKAIKADFLVLGVFKAHEEESTLYTLVYAVKNDKLFKASETTFGHEMKGVNKRSKASYGETVAVIQEGKGEKALAAGFALAAAPAPEPVAAAPAPEPEAAKPAAPAPAPKEVAGPVNLDVDRSVLLSADDANKAREDTNAEESIAPVKKTPIHKQWWLWTIVGAVAVGGAVGLGVALKPGSNAKSNRVSLGGVNF